MTHGRALVAALVIAAGCVSASRVAPPPPSPPLRSRADAPALATSVPTAAHSRAPTLREEQILRQLMRETERLRGLRFLTPVAMRIEDRAGMRAYVSRALDDAVLRRTQRRYVALGLLAANVDIRRLLEALMEEELVGYYDPKKKLLAVRNDVADALDTDGPARRSLAWRETVVHELVHALQDQHLGLSEQLERARTTDADNAYAALVEGDAQLTMLAYALGEMGANFDDMARDDVGLQRALGATPARLNGQMRVAPALVREPLLFRYREGTRYAASLYTQGGFAAMNRAHASPPATTAEVLAHIDGLPRGSDFALVFPDDTCVRELGYVVADDDSLGSLEVAVALSTVGDSFEGVARGWSSDRYRVYVRDHGLASIWVLRFIDLRSAQRAQHAFARLSQDRGATRTVTRVGRDLLVLRGIDEKCEARVTSAARTSVP